MNKDKSLEGLRGLACLAVVAGHLLYVAFPFLARVRDPNQSNFLQRWPWEGWFSSAPMNILYNGDFAVIVFFTLSGFVLVKKFWYSGDRGLLIANSVKRYPRLIIPA